MSNPMLRSLLFVPGNKESMLHKALGFAPDAFVPDMEDSVPDAGKASARATIAAHLEALHGTGKRVIPRVNALDTGLTEDDLAAVIGSRVHAVSIGKVSSPADVDEVAGLLAALEHRAGIEEGSVGLIPWIETALGVVNCFSVLSASPRIVAAAFGAEDFTHDMQIERTLGGGEVAHARATFCVAARAARVPALDTPYFGFKDHQALRAEATEAKSLGFKGKFAIHPAQIEHINACFRPSETELAHARRVIEVFEQAERQGSGSTSLDGQVIDVPVVKRARALLAMVQGAADDLL